MTQKLQAQKQAQLKRISLRTPIISNLDLSKSYLADMQIRYGQFVNCEMDYMKLYNSNIYNTDLNNISFDGVNMKNTYLPECKFKNSSVTGTTFASEQLKDIQLINTATVNYDTK